MNSWFTVKVKYTKQLENGTLKRVTEPYLLAAMTFTDAEARIYEELGAMIRGEFMVTGITRTDLHDIFQYDDAETWYKCKITYGIDEEDGDKKKTVNQNFLVSANDVKDAYIRMEESLSTLMIDYQIQSIIVSPIVEIFPYREEDVASPAHPRTNTEEEVTPTKGVVFTNFSDEEEAEVLSNADESELDDSFSEENE